MKAINIDESNKLVINPMGFDLEKFKVAAANTQAPSVQEFTCVEPVEFGTGCFGDPDAFNRLQEILHSREEESISLLSEKQNTSEATFTALQEGDGGMEPAFC